MGRLCAGPAVCVTVCARCSPPPSTTSWHFGRQLLLPCGLFRAAAACSLVAQSRAPADLGSPEPARRHASNCRRLLRPLPLQETIRREQRATMDLNELIISRWAGPAPLPGMDCSGERAQQEGGASQHMAARLARAPGALGQGPAEEGSRCVRWWAYDSLSPCGTLPKALPQEPFYRKCSTPASLLAQGLHPRPGRAVHAALLPGPG